MKRRNQIFPVVLVAIFALIVISCEEQPVMDEGVPDATQEAQQTYELRGTIVSRDEQANTVTVDHEAIGDWMAAMTMSFPVRGAEVGDLPADGETITGTVNVSGTEYWLTDISIGAPMPPETMTGMTPGQTDDATPDE